MFQPYLLKYLLHIKTSISQEDSSLHNISKFHLNVSHLRFAYHIRFSSSFITIPLHGSLYISPHPLSNQISFATLLRQFCFFLKSIRCQVAQHLHSIPSLIIYIRYLVAYHHLFFPLASRVSSVLPMSNVKSNRIQLRSIFILSAITSRITLSSLVKSFFHLVARYHDSFR